MRQQLEQLRYEMARHNIQAYLIPTDDYHGSEYVGEFFKCRKYVSGFTGSAGTLLVMEDMAGLWTDGRYFIQAASQLRNSGVTLFKMEEAGVPTIKEYLKSHLKKGMTFGFDGRCMMESQAAAYREIAKECGAFIDSGHDLVDLIWTDRPKLSCEPAWLLEMQYAGQSVEDKLKALRQKLKEKNADTFLLASLDDICWLLNVRGNDVHCTPVVLSYFMMNKTDAIWYVQKACLNDTIMDAMKEAGVLVKEYEEIYQDVENLPLDSRVMIQSSKMNAALVGCIPKEAVIIEAENPTEMMKARKNPVEVQNERVAHIKDGVALTKFVYYLKTEAIDKGESEVSLGQLLKKLRQEHDSYVEESFEPIVAYADHGAMCHYSATQESDYKVEAKGFLLVDTGGHYLEGTTDTTRTFAVGPLTEEEKTLYTAVLRGHINLAAARFLPGCSGQSLDVLARGPLWEMGLDYNHGTGHGVGYLLNVHEGPNSFRYRKLPSRGSDCVMETGMITSDEPGIYLEDKFGVRLENMIVCCQDPEHEGFLCFDPLTMVPFDKAAIKPEDMTRREIAWLNAYHSKVYDTIAPYLNPEEAKWLKNATEAILDF